MSRQSGLFVGLVTLDAIYQVEGIPNSNQKIVALDDLLTVGGPATNAAIAFQHLGNRSFVLGAVGRHSLAQVAQVELQRWQIALADLMPRQTEPLPMSSILVTQSTGDRAVVSRNALRSQAQPEHIPNHVFERLATHSIAVVLIDGHQMAVGEAIAQQAKAQGIPIVVDAGSWKPNFETVLTQADYVICSANFYPPDCTTTADVLVYLKRLSIPYIAITQGQQPILYQTSQTFGEIPVPSVPVKDTLGAGDIFHGAFCHYLLTTPDFPSALQKSAQIASQSCQFFGTRAWLN